MKQLLISVIKCLFIILIGFSIIFLYTYGLAHLFSWLCRLFPFHPKAQTLFMIGCIVTWLIMLVAMLSVVEQAIKTILK